MRAVGNLQLAGSQPLLRCPIPSWHLSRSWCRSTNRPRYVIISSPWCFAHDLSSLPFFTEQFSHVVTYSFRDFQSLVCVVIHFELAVLCSLVAVGCPDRFVCATWMSQFQCAARAWQCSASQVYRLNFNSFRWAIHRVSSFRSWTIVMVIHYVGWNLVALFGEKLHQNFGFCSWLVTRIISFMGVAHLCPIPCRRIGGTWCTATALSWHLLKWDIEPCQKVSLCVPLPPTVGWCF